MAKDYHLYKDSKIQKRNIKIHKRLKKNPLMGIIRSCREESTKKACVPLTFPRVIQRKRSILELWSLVSSNRG